MEKKLKRAYGSSSQNAKRVGHEFRIKRVYDAPSTEDGFRFLVDRLWPRGIKRKALADTDWMREVASSPPLRKWFGHDASKWTEFQRRYRVELDGNAAAWKPFLEFVQKGNVTLLFAAREVEMNNATVLRDFLNEKNISYNQKEKGTKHGITIRR